MATTARQFFDRFLGLERSHGEYCIPADAKPNDKGKIEGKAETVHRPLTVALWERHLSGADAFGLGVVPIRDDACCVFGAIDVDTYDPPVDFKQLAAEIASAGLPLVPVRSKSGGAQMYLFTSAPAPAELVRTKLLEWSVALGYPGVEVFPKQTRLASEKDFGNWINMPYQGGRRSTRYAVGPDGAALTPEEFLELADRIAVSPEDLRGIEPEASDEDDWFEGSPPCLEVLSRRGFPEGTRNSGLFAIALYLKRRYPADYGARLMDYNLKFLDPPLIEGEVAVIARSAGRKAYEYKCRDNPLAGVCNRPVCLKREHGVGGGTNDPGVAFGNLVKVLTVPPVWLWDVNGARIELTTAELMDQRKFQARAVEELTEWPKVMKPGAWQEMVRAKLASAEVVEVPEDATREGIIWVHLCRFCTSKVIGKEIDELLAGKPFTDAERTYFCAADALQYLGHHRVSAVTEKELFRALRKRGVKTHEGTMKGKPIAYWSVPAIRAQSEPFSVPRMQETRM